MRTRMNRESLALYGVCYGGMAAVLLLAYYIPQYAATLLALF